MKKIFLILLAFVQITAAQVEYSSGRNNPSTISPFYADYACYKSDVAGKVRVDVFVQVPYANISFKKDDFGFKGGFNVTLTFMDESKNNIIFERNWKEKVNTDDFSQTISKSNFFIAYKSYDLVPGKYFLKCIVEDADSRRIFTRDINLLVREISASAGLSDLIFISDVLKDPGGDRMIPNVSASVTNKVNSLSFFIELYSDKKQEVVLEYDLYDAQKNISLKQEDPRIVTPGINPINHTIKNLNFSVGDYSVKVILKDTDRKEIASVEKKITSKIAGVPASIVDLDKAISQMIYIATPDEMDYIKDAKEFDEKMIRFMAFWDKKKPNKNSDDNPILYEYYRRIEYANKNFKGMGDGWRSDMGMVFVTFGPPSGVERHPFDINSKPYEIWDYNDINRSFVFVDQTGFGDYRLLDPDFSRWPGYRQ